MRCSEITAEHADETFSRHEIYMTGPCRIYIRRPDEGDMWTEIVLGAMGTLIVHGDGPDIAFRSWNRSTSFYHFMHWAGHSQPEYVRSKVCMGKATVFCEETARSSFVEAITERFRDLARDIFGEDAEGADLRELLQTVSGSDRVTVKALDDLVDAVGAIPEARSEFEIWRVIQENDPWGLFDECYDLGTINSRNLMNAMAACRRAVWLIDNKRAQGGTVEI